jgi:hypothetical protein
MAMIAMMVVVGGYGLAYYGLCLVKGKDVTIVQIFNPAGHYPALDGPFSKWPAAPPSQVFPSGARKPAARKGKGAPPARNAAPAAA